MVGKFLSRAARAGAWLALGGGLLPLAGATIGGANPYLDLAAQFLGLAGWGCALTALVFLVLRLPLAALAAGLIAGGALFIVWPRPVIESCAPGAQVRRIIFENVYAWNREAPKAVEFLAATGADILVLAEVWRRFEKALPALRALYPYAVDCRAVRRCDLLILSKFPLTDERTLALRPGGPNAVAAVSIALPEGELRLIATHPARPWPFNWPGVQRREAIGVGNGFAKLPSPRMLVGDLNAVTWGHVVRDLERRGEARALPGWGTWPSRFLPIFSLPIDQAIIGPGISCATKTVGPRTGSDHRPIIVDFALGARLP
jgi:endonuclease/exonuclease/phosphatase (EEP) superfamily protein YafD